MANMATEKELLKISEEYADKKGFKLNPDKKVVDIIIKGLIKNEAKYGFRYCPCRRVKGDKEEDKKIICPCVYHGDEIKKQGHCSCMLFLRK